MTPSQAREKAHAIVKLADPSSTMDLETRITQALLDCDRRAREEEREACTALAQQYADRNRVGESDDKLHWVSTYHRIAGENIRDDIRARKPAE